ncbi:hypothetical protein HHK36_022572 [Tetracentron sinense]|uniref:Fe2OG dioxygenase domain-containing protein n=1 Tax=Tetracentron sinense TaxID=13715 RepID=A0A834YR98_TETSI|nr:hypothetical protein HHK36_022572 [Tetracentron sinense]
MEVSNTGKALAGTAADYDLTRELKSLDCMKSDFDKTHFEIPIIDLEGVDKDTTRRKKIVEQVQDASETWGFFQVINHGIPINVLDELIDGVRRFNKQDTEVKKEFYTNDRNRMRKALHNNKFDLSELPSAKWRNTLCCNMAPIPPNPEELPMACRYVCPELELTTGRHSDNQFLTVLVQDHIGGLQVLHQNEWVDVPPVPGAIVVNIGDLLQVVKFASWRFKVGLMGAQNIGSMSSYPRIMNKCRSSYRMKKDLYLETLVSKYVAKMEID